MSDEATLWGVWMWTWTAILLSFVFFAGVLTLAYEQSWTAAERLYLSDYLKSGTQGKASATASSKYTLLEAVVGQGQQRLVLDDEIEQVPPDADGRPGYRLTEEGVKNGISRLTWVTGVFNDRGLHRVMSEAVYADHDAWEFRCGNHRVSERGAAHRKDPCASFGDEAQRAGLGALDGLLAKRSQSQGEFIRGLILGGLDSNPHFAFESCKLLE
ncbi:MAG: Type secretion system, TraD, DNA-binding domain protein [Acidobacteriaceae bacterium]|nr:Type secretion system, TraD, DNA-binding domain protein [Acidobacteriaceae bacterium]